MKKEIIMEKEMLENVVEEKVAEKKAARKKRTKKAAMTVYIQKDGIDYIVDEIVKKVTNIVGKEDVKIYIKPEDKRAYYVTDSETGSVEM